jgi:hypothetical protein
VLRTARLIATRPTVAATAAVQRETVGLSPIEPVRLTMPLEGLALRLRAAAGDE